MTAAQHTSTLGEETAFVKRYIELQRARFSDRLDVQYAISPESESCAVPAFLLQPLVENAFRHGVAKRCRPCRLELAASVDERRAARLGPRRWRRAAGGLQRDRPRRYRPAQHHACACSASMTARAQLRLEPADGGGTVAHIRLPAQTGSIPRPAGHSMTTFRVLVVDDEPLAREVAVNLLAA